GGDCDGDGIPDFAVGAPEFDDGGNIAVGGAWIFRGSDGALLYELLGTTQNEFVGRSVAYVGNIPRSEAFGPDVFGDFAIGVPASLSNRRVVVVGHAMDSATTSAFTASTINAPFSGNAGAGFGFSVAGLDFNGDGTPDVAVGSPNATSLENFSGRGRAYVFSGVDLATQLFFRDGKQNNNQRLGSAVANAGDFDGLPGDELGLGSRGYQPSGGSSNSGSVEVYAYSIATSLGTLCVRIDGDESNMQLGSRISPAGDLDNDGLADLLVGQGGPTTNFLGGNAYVICGSALSETGDISTSPRVTFRVSDEITIFGGDGLGGSGLAGGFDTDGDGRAEILIGAANRGSSGGGQVVAFSSGPPPPDPAMSEIFADPLIISSFGGLSTITVTPLDASGTLIGPGASVSFATTAGNLLGTVVDPGDGTYSQQLEGVVGDAFAEVSATVNGVTIGDTVLIAFVEVDPDTSTVEVDAASTFLGGIHAVTVTPRDDIGALLGPGLAVTIESTIGTLTGSVTDNGDGTYSQGYEATEIGTAAITATVDLLPLATGASLTVLDPASIGSIIGAES
ncbi:MAG: FG-GAP repeat protein, partial [Planctomycetes bacterium]|nr:FG-GAP repeat protein [Planctomycetota bacterium]